MLSAFRHTLFPSVMVLAGLMVFPGCSRKNSENIQAETADMEARFTEALDELIQRRNSIQVMGRPLTRKERSFTEKVDALEAEYKIWRSADPPQTKEQQKARYEAMNALFVRAEQLLQNEA